MIPLETLAARYNSGQKVELHQCKPGDIILIHGDDGLDQDMYAIHIVVHIGKTKIKTQLANFECEISEFDILGLDPKEMVVLM